VKKVEIKKVEEECFAGLVMKILEKKKNKQEKFELKGFQKFFKILTIFSRFLNAKFSKNFKNKLNFRSSS
jgi:hypothetical protein